MPRPSRPGPRPLAGLALALALVCFAAEARSQGGGPVPEADPAPAASPEPADGPWRLERAWGTPDWFHVGVEQRTRYESLDEDFRKGVEGSNQLWALRTSVRAEIESDRLRLGAEVLDSRVLDFPADAVLDTGIVNAAELLQAYVGFESTDVFAGGDRLDVLFGRQTLDLGSRRLVARNRFRNTINAFTGLNALWTARTGASVRAFVFNPVNRLPRDLDSLRDNEVEFDEELDDTVFWGLVGERTLWDDDVDGQLYLFGLDEDDERNVNTRNRRLATLGARILREPRAGGFGYEWESALQFGESRDSTAAANTEDLDHLAHFHHLSVAYRFEGETRPELELLFDYASGDGDPDDGDNGRFDTLYGARRFEFGPTGILGAFARSNLISPGLRFMLRPTERTQLFLSHRLGYLASDRDAWTTASLSDPSGASDRFIGQLAEIRLRYDVAPKNLRLEVGMAHLFAGGFIDDVSDGEDTNYFYFQSTLTL